MGEGYCQKMSKVRDLVKGGRIEQISGVVGVLIEGDHCGSWNSRSFRA